MRAGKYRDVKMGEKEAGRMWHTGTQPLRVK